MNIKRELIATAVRLIAENTNLIRKPDAWEQWFDSILGNESYDQRIASNVETEAARLAEGVRRYRTHRTFNRIISKI